MTVVASQSLTRPHLGAAALNAAAQGWCVFPLVPGQKRPRAVLVDWERRATIDPDRIGRWWTRHPHDNVAIACGPSGLVVVDLDCPKHGETPPQESADARHGLDVLHQLAHRYRQPLPGTWTVETPSGGRHLYYQAPTSVELRNTSGRLGWRIDTRAQGGYVVAAGSIVDGRGYRIVEPTPLVPLPDWITQLLDPPPLPPVTSRTPTGPTKGRYVEAAVAGEVQRVLTAGPHARNWALYKAAWHLSRLVACGDLSAAVVEDTLQRAAVEAGYRDGPRAALAVVRSAIRRRLR